VVFALIHLPNRLVSGFSGLALVLGLVYLRTGNLCAAVGLRALVDAPTLLFAGSGIPAMVTLAVIALALLIWPRLAAVRATTWAREASTNSATANRTPSPTR
jgi:membrane protease YdiL (CAAX protease family)